MNMTAPVGAQTTISGTLVGSGTQTPVEGATVSLIDSSGDPVAWRLTNAAGRFGFASIRAGTYTLRTDRIGHASVLSDPFTVEDGEAVVRRIDTPVEAIILAGIEVAGSRRCEVRPGQGEGTATVWEEARKALEATSRTSRLGVYSYVIRRYERDWDARARQVRSEESRIERRQLASPFRSLDIDDLVEKGFIDEGTYYAPDADVLLSDRFLDTHCMSLSEGEGEAEGLLGLSFEPTEDRGVTDISGVLWLNLEDAELQWLDYQYEFLDVPNSERLGGKILFAGLPDGTWIVREWYIRMPYLEVVVERGRPDRTWLVGIKEVGGLVVRVNTVRGDLVLDSRAGIIEGVVLDFRGSEPVEGVVVLLDDSTPVTTDADGRFQFSGLVEGYHGLRVVNPVLDSLGLSPDPVFFEARPGDVTSASLRFGSLDALMTDRCAGDDSSENDGILTGLVLDHNGDVAVGARISVQWQTINEQGLSAVRDAAVGIPATLQSVEEGFTTSEISDDGVFLACGVPRDRRVEVTAEWNGVKSSPEQFYLVPTQLVSRRNITIPAAR